MRRVTIIAYILIQLCSAQHDVNDFRFVTWNTAGAHWTDVMDLMVDGNIDVMAIQECGGNPPAVGERRTGSEGNIIDYQAQGLQRPQFYYIGRTPNEVDPSHYILEFIWTTRRGDFYMYYTERRRHEDMMKPTQRGDRLPSSSINMAIITKQPAERTFYMQPVDRFGNEIFGAQELVNRPVIGVQIKNTIFFNLHAEPNRNANEAPAVVNNIHDYMISNFPTLTWAVIGDFNRLHDSFQLLPGSHTQVVHSDEITHVPRGNQPGQPSELDYGVLGGPLNYVFNVHADLLPLALRQRFDNVSDHKAVKFN